MNTAKALDLAIPLSILIRADEGDRIDKDASGTSLTLRAVERTELFHRNFSFPR